MRLDVGQPCRDATRAGNGEIGLFLLVVLVHRGDVNRLVEAHHAVAGVHHYRMVVDRLVVEHGHNGRRCDLGVLVGHVTRFGHEWRDLYGVAQHVDVLVHRRFEGHVVHRTPATVHIGQPGPLGNDPRALLRNDVDHIGLHRAVHFELDFHRLRVHPHHVAVGHVLHHARIHLGPGFFEQRLLRLHLVVGVENDDLGLGFVLFEVGGHQRGALVRAGRAAVGGLGHRDGEHPAVAHGLDLLAQRHGFRAGFHGNEQLARFIRSFQSLDRIEHQIDAGRDHELVVLQRVAVGELDGVGGRVDAFHHAFDPFHAVAVAQRVVGGGDVLHRLGAGDDQIGNRAGDEGIARIDHRHLDGVARPVTDVFGRSRAAITGADDDDLAFARGAAGGAGAARQRGCETDGAHSGGACQEFATGLHGVCVLTVFAARNRWR